MRHPLVLVGLAGCAAPSILPSMARFDRLGLFADRAHDGCAPDVVSAWGGPHQGLEVAALAAAGTRLYAFRHSTDGTWLTTLDVSDPRDVRELGSGRLPGLGWVTRTAATDGLLLAAWEGHGQHVAVIDPADPRDPVLLDVLDVGRTGAPSSFAPAGDLVFTDAGELHALDLTEPSAAVGLAFDGLPPLGAPVTLGGLVLANVDDGPIGEECSAVVVDPAASPPAVVARLEGTICASVGHVPVDGGALGVGWSDGDPWVEAVSTAPWAATGRSALAPWDVLPESVAGVDGGALVFADERSVLFRVRDGVPTHAASWWPPSAWLESAVDADGLAWVAVSSMAGDFDGVVALDFGRCP